MTQRRFVIFFFLVITILIDYYFYQALSLFVTSYSPYIKFLLYTLHSLLLLITVSLTLLYGFQARSLLTPLLQKIFTPLVFMTYVAKFFGCLVLLMQDIIRFIQALWFRLYAINPSLVIQTIPPRTLLMVQASMVATALPLIVMGYGVAFGAHAYCVRNIRISLPNLPANFHGIKIAQLSDIHCGSFFNKKAVAHGIDMLLAEKPDIIFFTGDLVNNTAEEAKPYIPILRRVKAELGVYSTLGNHDYGDYITWSSAEEKRHNLNTLCNIHATLGWTLLRNQHCLVTIQGAQLAVLGVDNWGTNFSQYGCLAQAYQGTADIPIKLLLSHDPSHWDAQIRPEYGSVDVTFSGHTHGFQFGIEIGNFQWSPVQYRYKQWAGLYQEGSQYLYVNRGFGYIGYPGRIGIWPEITMVTLEKSSPKI